MATRKKKAAKQPQSNATTVQFHQRTPESTQRLLNELQASAATELTSASSMSPKLYNDAGIGELELERVWKQDWVCPGLAAEIPDTGDFLTYSIGGEPIFCIRDKAGDVRTFSNVCRHRMMQLLDGTGQTKRITCPYHAWAYGLDGKLLSAGQMRENETYKKSELCLPELRTEIWNGWIYVTLNEHATPVSESLAALGKVVDRYNMSEYIPVVNENHVWDTNWKLLTENFMEGYHLPIAHKATVGAWFPVEDTVFPKRVFDAFTYQTYSKAKDAAYGLAHKDNKKLKGKWRHTSVLPTVFPSHMYVLAPDHLWYLSLRPKGIGQVDVRFGVALAPEVYHSLDNRDWWINDLVTFFEQVNAEDRHVVEGIFRGSMSEFATPGPLSWLEREIHDFKRYLARRLCQPDT